ARRLRGQPLALERAAARGDPFRDLGTRVRVVLEGRLQVGAGGPLPRGDRLASPDILQGCFRGLVQLAGGAFAAGPRSACAGGVHGRDRDEDLADVLYGRRRVAVQRAATAAIDGRLDW